MTDDRRREKLDEPTDEELDELAKITPEDIERASARWKKDAPPEFRDLLDAEQR